MNSKVLVLLRGINVGGNKKVPMADLRELASNLGYENPKTYIASGNLILTTNAPPAAVVKALAPAIETHFGFKVDLIARTASQWATYAKGGVYPEAEQDRANLVHLALSSVSGNDDVVQAILAYAKNDERVCLAGDAVWLDYPNGAGRSKITPKVLARAFGAPVTSRNFRTVLKLDALVQG